MLAGVTELATEAVSAAGTQFNTIRAGARNVGAGRIPSFEAVNSNLTSHLLGHTGLRDFNSSATSGISNLSKTLTSTTDQAGALVRSLNAGTGGKLGGGGASIMQHLTGFASSGKSGLAQASKLLGGNSGMGGPSIKLGKLAPTAFGIGSMSIQIKERKQLSDIQTSVDRLSATRPPLRY
jgi:hypothetical protein